MTADELIALAKHSRQSRFAPGDALLAESTESVTYANIMRGVVKLSKMLSDGRQQLVGLQFAPDFLGRPFANESPVTAEAASAVEACRFPKAALENMISDNPDLERRLLEQTLKELDEAREWMVTLGRKTASEKVASFLFLIATHIDPIRSIAMGRAAFDLPLTRADIADFLGLTVETVSRQLTRLRTDAVIEITNNRHVNIPDLDNLRDRMG